MTTLNNMLDQALDIRGSDSHSPSMPYSEESSYLGKALSGQTGSAATVISGGGSGQKRIGGLTGMTATSVGNFLTLKNSTDNDGTFMIDNYVNANTVDVLDASPGTIPDASNGSIDWVERRAYSLADDLDYDRSDRANIKGVAYDAAIPTYERPSAVGTNVDANLNNIAGNTLDAKTKIIARKFENQSVAEGDTFKLLSDAGNLKHADSTDRRGIPIYDGADAGDVSACYCEIIPQGQMEGLTVIGKAVGEITTVAVANLVDGETTVINDGTNPAVTFEFDDDYSVTETTTLRQVDISGITTADEVRDALIAAINNAPALNVLAENGGAATVKLTNEVPGTAGNQTITETVTNAGYVVSGMAGGSADAGMRIYGVMYDGTGASPNSVEVRYYKVAQGDPMSVANAYTWERDQPTTIDFYYPYRRLLSEITETEERITLTHGIVGDAGLTQRVSNLQDVISESLTDDLLHIGTLLTDTGNYYVWSDLADATPSVVECLNAINAQIGDRTYTGSVLTSGDPITDSLQDLADAISDASGTRYIEKITSAESPGTVHTLPGSATYTLDSTGNGQWMWLFTRGMLRHPGDSAADYDYEETSTTTITWLRAQPANSLLDFVIWKAA